MTTRVRSKDVSPKFVRSVQSPPVLVVGGAGYLGSELCHRLLQAGERVRVLDALTTADARLNRAWLTRHGDALEFHEGDAADPREVAAAMRGVNFVFNLLDGNEQATLHILERSRAAEGLVPVICSSTLRVLPGPAAADLDTREGRHEPRDANLRYAGYDERSTPKSLEGPAGARLVTERRALSFAWHFGVPVVVLRFGELMGLTRHGGLPRGWVEDVVTSALRGWPPALGIHPGDVRDLLFVDDAVKALLAARRKLGLVAGGLFHVCGGPDNALSAAELLVRMGSPFTPARVQAPPNDAPSAERPRSAWRVGNFTRFSLATGWAPSVRASVAAVRLYRASVKEEALAAT